MKKLFSPHDALSLSPNPQIITEHLSLQVIYREIARQNINIFCVTGQRSYMHLFLGKLLALYQQNWESS